MKDGAPVRRSLASSRRKGKIVDLELTGKRVVVTGAGRGIGLAVTRGFVAEGAHVVAGSRATSPELEELANAGSVTPVEVDLATADGPGKLVEAAGGLLDVLVNNVGSAPARPAGFAAVTDEEWARTWNLNVMAAVRATRAALPVMLAAGGGAIVNIGSVNARLADPMVIDYSASKAALVNLAKSLSKEFGARGIRVNTVDPGPVATDLWLADGGVAATISAAQGVDPGAVAAGAAAGDGPLQPSRRGRRHRAAARQPAHGQRHRRRLHDRRRHDHHRLTGGEALLGEPPQRGVGELRPAVVDQRDRAVAVGRSGRRRRRCRGPRSRRVSPSPVRLHLVQAGVPPP